MQPPLLVLRLKPTSVFKMWHCKIIQFQILWFYTPELHLVYKVRCSGGLHVNFDHVWIANMCLNLDTQASSNWMWIECENWMWVVGFPSPTPQPLSHYGRLDCQVCNSGNRHCSENTSNRRCGTLQITKTLRWYGAHDRKTASQHM